jgi:hypothetical protein
MAPKRGDKVQWQSGYNPTHWFKGKVLYFILPKEPPATSANTFAVIDDGLGLTPRLVALSRVHRAS